MWVLQRSWDAVSDRASFTFLICACPCLGSNIYAGGFLRMYLVGVEAEEAGTLSGAIVDFLCGASSGGESVGQHHDPGLHRLRL